ncbi:MAG: hypothetical protein H6741_09820 [Alphaproteobacteria bacterium]|nr:hypothetical protein [Alphaproteobacteria bacterium]MCB9793009.1 hypothetical protein [Alphaproteobacteria bacterium]
MDKADILERALWDTFWLPPDAERVERPELLYLRSEHPDASLNIVLRVRPTGAEHARRLVAEVSARHLGPSRFVLTPQSRFEYMRPALEAWGYRRQGEFDAMLAPVDSLALRRVPEVRVRVVEDMQALRDGLFVLESEGKRVPSGSALQGELDGCTGVARRTWRFIAYVHDDPVCVGNMDTFPALGLAVFWGGTTLAERRGRGLYTAVVRARVARAQALGLSHVGLYARLSSSAPIVEKQGFQRFGRMEHWDRA